MPYQKQKKEYNEFKPKAHELRENYLYNIANELADEDPQGRPVQHHHSKLIWEESTNSTTNILNNRRGVDKVDVQGVDGVWQTVHNKEDIAEHIKIANKEKKAASKAYALQTGTSGNTFRWANGLWQVGENPGRKHNPSDWGNRRRDLSLVLYDAIKDHWRDWSYLDNRRILCLLDTNVWNKK
jgi:hypothetical protein